MVDNAYERLLASEELLFPEGQPIGAAHDDIVGNPVVLGHETSEGDAAYVVKTVTGTDGSVSVEYVTPDDEV